MRDKTSARVYVSDDLRILIEVRGSLWRYFIPPCVWSRKGRRRRRRNTLFAHINPHQHSTALSPPHASCRAFPVKRGISKENLSACDAIGSRALHIPHSLNKLWMFASRCCGYDIWCIREICHTTQRALVAVIGTHRTRIHARAYHTQLRAQASLELCFRSL